MKELVYFHPQGHRSGNKSLLGCESGSLHCPALSPSVTNCGLPTQLLWLTTEPLDRAALSNETTGTMYQLMQLHGAAMWPGLLSS